MWRRTYPLLALKSTANALFFSGVGMDNLIAASSVRERLGELSTLDFWGMIYILLK
jgi:hypothetical protein